MLPGNAMVWDRERRGHYEVWYLTLTHLASGRSFWIRSTIESPLEGVPYCEVWFASFDRRAGASFGVHQRFPAALLESSTEPFRVAIGSHAEQTSGSAGGALTCAGHDIRWDLTWPPSGSRHLHLPPRVYDSSRVDTKVMSENLSVPISGRIVCDGEELVFTGDPGGQSHVWGRKHAHAWVWSHCNAFEGAPSAVWEGLSVRLSRAGVVLPTMTLCSLTLDGETFAFTRFRDALRTSGRWQDARYVARAHGLRVRLEAEFTARPESTIATPYVDPDGQALFCMNSCVADARVTLYRRSRFGARFQQVAVLSAPGRGHWEWGQRLQDPSVTTLHQGC